ncbi:hypothetical protein BDI4_300026 [Burkholderia diffusa]|nr:hypothetical protein BDI4_300026 [Burkholderia diffusa]
MSSASLRIDGMRMPGRNTRSSMRRRAHWTSWSTSVSVAVSCGAGIWARGTVDMSGDSNCTEGYRADCTVTVPVPTITVDRNGDRAAAVAALPHAAPHRRARIAARAPAGSATARRIARLP